MNADDGALIEHLESIINEKGGIPACELTELASSVFGYWDDGDYSIIGFVKNVCRELGISTKCKENVLAIVNALKGGVVDWENAWLFVEPDMLANLMKVLDAMPLTKYSVCVRRM